MNILLVAVNAKYIHSNLAVYSLKASAGAYEPQVELAEFTINHQTDDIFRAVYQKRPALLFFLLLYLESECDPGTGREPSQSTSPDGNLGRRTGSVL